VVKNSGREDTGSNGPLTQANPTATRSYNGKLTAAKAWQTTSNGVFPPLLTLVQYLSYSIYFKPPILF